MTLLNFLVDFNKYFRIIYSVFKGGEGHVGTLRSFDDDIALVIWDNGICANYRCSAEIFDLRLLDSSPCGLAHDSIKCQLSINFKE